MKRCDFCYKCKPDSVYADQKILGKNLETVFYNLTGILVTPEVLRNTYTCIDCAITFLQAEPTGAKVRMVLLKKATAKYPKKRRMTVSSPEELNANTAQDQNVSQVVSQPATNEIDLTLSPQKVKKPRISNNAKEAVNSTIADVELIEEGAGPSASSTMAIVGIDMENVKKVVKKAPKKKANANDSLNKSTQNGAEEGAGLSPSSTTEIAGNNLENVKKVVKRAPKKKATANESLNKSTQNVTEEGAGLLANSTNAIAGNDLGNVKKVVKRAPKKKATANESLNKSTQNVAEEGAGLLANSTNAIAGNDLENVKKVVKRAPKKKANANDSLNKCTINGGDTNVSISKETDTTTSAIISVEKPKEKAKRKPRAKKVVDKTPVNDKVENNQITINNSSIPDALKNVENNLNETKPLFVKTKDDTVVQSTPIEKKKVVKRKKSETSLENTSPQKQNKSMAALPSEDEAIIKNNRKESMSSTADFNISQSSFGGFGSGGDPLRECLNCGKAFHHLDRYEAHVLSKKCQHAAFACKFPSCMRRFFKLEKMYEHMERKHDGF